MQTPLNGIEPPHALKPWLTLETSMTERLQQETGEALVRVLKQQWLQCSWFACHVHGEKGCVLQREVVIQSKEKHAWYARTFIPQRTLMNNGDCFAPLAQHSLGHIIFSDSSIVRTTLNALPLDARHLAFHWPDNAWVRNETTLWARYGAFHIDADSPFYVYEILLPDLYEINDDLTCAISTVAL